MIKPEDFLETATRLLDNGSEADLRSAASRAYYAAFHICLTLSNRLLFEVPRKLEEREAKLGKSPGNHEIIIRILSYCVGIKDSETQNLETNMKFKQLGKELKSARSSRTSADYKINDPFELAAAQQAVLKCNDIVKEASRLLQTISS